MATYDDAVDRLTAQFGSENAATIRAVVNEKQREMLARAEYRGSTPSLGTTVAGQTQYALTDTVASYRLLRIGTTMYRRVGTETLWQLQDADSGVYLSGPGGVFAPNFNDSGSVAYVEFYPEPDAGQAIEALSFGWVADLTYGSSSALSIPSDLFPQLLSGCRAYLYREVEERPDLAPPEEEDFQAGIVELRARKNRRLGGGPARMRVGVGGRW